MEQKITADWKKISEDGEGAAINHFFKGKEIIDGEFGKGYCKSHPELLAAFIQAAAIDSHGSVIGKCIQQLAEELKPTLDETARQVFNLSEAVRLR